MNTPLTIDAVLVALAVAKNSLAKIAGDQQRYDMTDHVRQSADLCDVICGLTFLIRAQGLRIEALQTRVEQLEARSANPENFVPVLR